ncbi:hypothetical protein [Mycolicibacterium hippocampi]|nr:hypothetical protein [Mycolicibacterium hippocampi]
MQGPADYAMWVERYGTDYATEAAREAGYRDYLANHAITSAVMDEDDRA